MVTIFTLMNCFFLKTFNNFVGFITLVLKKMAHLNEKPSDCSHSSRSSRVL